MMSPFNATEPLVLGLGNLLRGFRSKRECLDVREITQIFDAARKPQTWVG